MRAFYRYNRLLGVNMHVNIRMFALVLIECPYLLYVD